MSAGLSPAIGEWSPRALRGLLHAAREEVRDAEEAMVYAVVGLHLVCAARVAAPCDEEAEQRVLGAMMLGRVTRRDVAGLERVDFAGEGHLALFAAISEVARIERLLGRRARPSCRRDPRALAAELARLRRERVRRRLEGDEAALRALDTLPWPATSPSAEIATVRALGAWRRRAT